MLSGLYLMSKLARKPIRGKKTGQDLTVPDIYPSWMSEWPLFARVARRVRKVHTKG